MPSLLSPLTALSFPGENDDNKAMRVILAALMPSFSVSYLQQSRPFLTPPPNR